MQPWWEEETSFRNIKKSYQLQTYEQNCIKMMITMIIDLHTQ